jgi:hypothetical protein
MDNKKPENNKKKNKQVLIFAGIATLIVLAVVLSWMFVWGASGSNNQAKNKNRPTPTETQIQLSEDEQPVITLDINNDRSGATLTVASIADRFNNLEYELIYTAEADGQEIERGVAGGPVEVPESRQVSEDMLFGTESCTTGTCHRRIDKNVSKGVLLIRLVTEDNQTWSLEKEFNIEEEGSGFKAVWVE